MTGGAAATPLVPPTLVVVETCNSGGAPSLYKSPSDLKMNTDRNGEITAEINHPT